MVDSIKVKAAKRLRDLSLQELITNHKEEYQRLYKGNIKLGQSSSKAQARARKVIYYTYYKEYRIIFAKVKAQAK